jgi:hypothetical protein
MPFDAHLKRGEREKQLEVLLQKTKKDKDKAIRLIVQIVGKVGCLPAESFLIMSYISYFLLFRIEFLPFSQSMQEHQIFLIVCWTTSPTIVMQIHSLREQASLPR